MKRKLAALILAVPLAIVAFTGCSSGLLNTPGGTQKTTSQNESASPTSTPSETESTEEETTAPAAEPTEESTEQTGSWPALVKQNYMASCTGSAGGVKGAKEYCQCTLDALQKQYSATELIELEKTITSSQDSPEAKKFQDVVKSCVGELSK